MLFLLALVRTSVYLSLLWNELNLNLQGDVQ